jgi:hypothetical protein
MAFETAISVFERAMTVHALERAATVIGSIKNYSTKIRQPARSFTKN